MTNNKEVVKKTKTNTTKKNTSTKNVKKTPAKKTGTNKTQIKKTTTKKSTTPKVEVVKKDKIETVNTVNINIEEKVSEQEKIEKEVIEEINSIKVVKLDETNNKPIKKDKSLIAIGVILSTLGIIALFISLISNRIIDKEFLSDNVVILMLAISLVIEGFGAFIIVSET